MNDNVWLGKGMDKLELDEDYGDIELVYIRDTFFGNKKRKLEDYQIRALIDLIIKYLRTTNNKEIKERKELTSQLNQLIKEQKELEKRLSVK